jgi:hypothetical protein
MMQRRRTKLSPRGTAFSGATPTAPARRDDPSGTATPSGLSQTSESAKPVGSLPHFARQTQSSLQRNAQRASDGRVRTPFTKLSENQTPNSIPLKTPGTKASHATDKSQIAKTPKPGFLSSFGGKRPPAAKVKPGESGLSGPTRAPSQRGFLGISPPWQQKGVIRGGEPSPTPTTKIQAKISPPQRLTVDTSQSALKPAIESATHSVRLGISPVWTQPQEILEEGASSFEPNPIDFETGNADGATPSAATLTTLLGVFSTFAEVWGQPALDDTASAESVEDVPLSVLVRPRESLGGVSEISDGSASISLDESSEADEDESSASSASSESVMSSLGSSTAQSHPSTTADVLSIGGSDMTDREEEEDDIEKLLQLPDGLRLPSRALKAATPRKESQDETSVPAEQVETSTSDLLSPPQSPSLVMEQYQHGLPSLCVGRLLRGADDDSSEDMSTSTNKSELERYMHSIFSPTDLAFSCDELDTRNRTALFDDEDPRCTNDGIVDDSILMSDEQLRQQIPACEETPAIDEALRMFSTEDFDSVALFADLSDELDDSIFSVVSDPLLQLVQSNCAFLDETQRQLLSDQPQEMNSLDTTDGVQPYSSPSPSLERLAWLLTPKIESDVVSSNVRSHMSPPQVTFLEKKSCDDQELWATEVETAAVESRPQLFDRDSSTEYEVIGSAAVLPSPTFDHVDSVFLPSTRDESLPNLVSLSHEMSDHCVEQPELSTNAMLSSEWGENPSTVQLTPADEIRKLRIQVELLTRKRESLESLLKVAVRELVASTCCYTSEDKALEALHGKAGETTTTEGSTACVLSVTLDGES